ncbi:hypothetical protein [Streptomyces sp. NPDC048442]|uniref:hypothetical protein n=1 Tax=Streptomyces sp. NPDC048442 TaxID=3154823 RepID=UPI003412D8E7
MNDEFPGEPSPESDDAAPPEAVSSVPASGSAESGQENDGPVSESDALLSLARGGGADEAERAEAVQAGAIADLIAQRLNSEASGTRIGTLALFNDSVSFGGGFHTGGRPSSRASGGSAAVPLDAHELGEFTERYIHPDGYHEALDSLRSCHLLVLTAPPGTGREAAAVNLLAEAMALSGGEGGNCARIHTPSVITAPGWEPPSRNSGYLVLLDEGPSGVEALGETGLRGLAETAASLKAAHSHLVLVGGHQLALAAAQPGGEALARHQLAAVDPVALVEHRVLGHGAGPGLHQQLRAQLAESGAAAALYERPSAGHAARLASTIAADGDLTAAVAALRDPSEQVFAWFSRHRTPEAIAFALAAAVLEDSSYLTVADAAVALRTALAPSSATEVPPDLRFRDRLSEEQPWIELAHPEPAHPESGRLHPAGGPPTVRFRSTLLRQVVLVYAWTTLDGCRAAVLTWLRRLLTHADLEVRARAAVAAGVLAWADHHYAVHRFLKSWAGSTSWPLRQAAATALGVAGSRPESTEPVWDLLRAWAGNGTSAYDRRLAGTAANAVGGLLGRDSPERALDVLGSALDRGDDWGTLTPVAWGSVHLLHQGRVDQVLNAFLRWSAPKDLSPMVVKALSVFVFAVSRPYEESAGSSPRSTPGVPMLLSEVSRHPEQLAELWARAMARQPVQDQAFDALRTWLDQYADLCPGALDSIRELLLDISCKPGKHRSRILWWLEKWSHDRERPTPHAQELWLAVKQST